MEKTTLNVPNISCEHCVNAIKNELSELEGVKSVEGDVNFKTITIEWDKPATIESIQNTLREMNYPAV